MFPIIVSSSAINLLLLFLIVLVSIEEVDLLCCGGRSLKPVGSTKTGQGICWLIQSQILTSHPVLTRLGKSQNAQQ